MRRLEQQKSELPETAATITEQLAALSERHGRNLRRVHEYEAYLHYQDALDMYHSREDLPETETENLKPQEYDVTLDVSAYFFLDFLRPTEFERNTAYINARCGSL